MIGKKLDLVPLVVLASVVIPTVGIIVFDWSPLWLLVPAITPIVVMVLWSFAPVLQVDVQAKSA